MSLIDLVQQHLGPNEMQQISQQLGVDNATAQQAVQSALPSMVAGMAGQSQEPAGANAIQSAVGSHEGLLGNLGNLGNLGGLGGMLSGAMGGGGGGGGLLGSILGRHEPAVHDQVQQSTGLDAGKSKQLLMILAPIVLAAIAHKRSQAAASGAGQPDVGDVLTQEAQQAQHSSGMGGLLGKVMSHVEGRQR